ncbi:ankyrin repeat and kinase domain-containing 1-like [Chlorella sorokiniana]|uniref:Ankyrin repeat and kinase domain-containing 1-like n=1 Tax=Chlorella sorokiniana TaxID=3076 RepID=A0A2P6TS08_CHLSO|nr:ankyrin repeat and kinase domain-containing 1-like [Chlorella sorokiniana]|eukprot:PRW56848.1 ankyrin repeat and kinase domain-containing 1-like [Chlorella sorokiniana]
MVQLLLNHGADVAACDSHGRTACHTAATHCSPASASAALLCLARRAPRLLGQGAHGAGGDTPIHVLCRLPEAGCLPSLRALASGGLLTGAALGTANAAGQTPLALVAAVGSVAVVELLLRSGASPAPPSPCPPPCRGFDQPCGSRQRHSTAQHDAQQSPKPSACPLGAAAAGGHYGCLLALLWAGASASQLSCSVLEQACQQGRADVAATLLAAGLALSSGEAQRLLLVAVERGDEALLAALLGGGLDPNSPGDAPAAERLLHVALRPGREALLRRLLGLWTDERSQQACRMCRALDVSGLAGRLQANPLLFAVRHSSLEALRCLLAAGCPPGAMPPGAGLPPLVAAASRLDAARTALLLHAGAPAGETDRQGQSALDAVLALCTDARLVQLAAEETQGAAATTERQLLQLVEMLVAAGAPCARFLADHWPAAAAAAGAVGAGNAAAAAVAAPPGKRC